MGIESTSFHKYFNGSPQGGIVMEKPTRLLLLGDLQQIDFENQRRIGADVTPGTPFPVGKVCGNKKLVAAAHGHLLKPFGPTWYHPLQGEGGVII